MIPETVNGNPTFLGKNSLAIDQIFDDGLTILLEHNELEVQNGWSRTIEPDGCCPGVLIDVFHAIGLGVIPMAHLVTITNNGN